MSNTRENDFDYKNKVQLFYFLNAYHLLNDPQQQLEKFNHNCTEKLYIYINVCIYMYIYMNLKELLYLNLIKTCCKGSF